MSNVDSNTKKSNTGTPGGTKVISVQGNDLSKIINSETGGQSPQRNVPSGNQVPPKQSGGGPEGPPRVSPQITSAVQPKAGVINTATGNVQNPPPPTNVTAPSGTVNNPDDVDVDVDKMIASGEQETKELDAEIQARKDKMELLQRAINSRNNFERLIYNNVETGEFIGTKLKYIEDSDGKTVYDYMNDPEVSEHLEFVAAEGDAQDGSPVDRQVTFYWKKPTF